MKNQGEINLGSIINTLKYGVRVLSHVQHHFGSASGIKVSLASLLGVAGIILALRHDKARTFRSSDENSDSVKFWVVPGLHNLGNNCFLNVILQALASCSCFRCFLQMRLGEFEALSVEELAEALPLAVSLDSLLEELCTPRDVSEVLNPREVMNAVDHYNRNFKLTNQQDAEEAFFLIFSSLREELAELYVSNQGSLADVTALANSRIISLERMVLQSWQQNILGPFDGILSSILTCRSCSIQISLDFQYFHSLHLSLMAGSSVEGCLKHFFAAEQLEHYHCSNCWHTAAINYLSITHENEADVIKLRNCSKQDSSCDCRNISRLGALPWSNTFSRTFKQLNVARSPKILCLHLQRASVNVYGELVKFQGHISFPLTLNLSRFMNSAVEIKSCKENLRMWQSTQHRQPPFSFSKHLDMQLDTRRLNPVYGQMRNKIFLEAEVLEESGEAASVILDNRNIQDSQGQPSLSKIGGYSDITAQNSLLESNDEVGGTHDLVPADLHLYQLVSVVQHFGRAGSGHYTVYRRVRAKLPKSSTPDIQWFGISDSQVYSVSEEIVLGAEASVLFYEKISESTDDF